MIQTVLGALASNQLGRVDAHEHVFLRSPALRGEEYGEIEPMTVELSAVRSTGIDTVVDLTPIGLGREPLWLAEVARRSGVQIVAAKHLGCWWRRDLLARAAPAGLGRARRAFRRGDSPPFLRHRCRTPRPRCVSRTCCTRSCRGDSAESSRR